ncbi:unnamed protein product [Dracunculus medinensis]|uniref:G-protein coupled receptors family 1 profile domain-containing protein n=1 Tax=Dracunculus medinensis TaxID=318479 RepID=A0A3P7SKF3_DRAME|nr:unnamed protein product [Dracunculus medinensis]
MAHIIVLTRKNMRSFAINTILSLIATCDIVIMAFYLIYIIRFRFIDDSSRTNGYTYGWLVFLLIHVVSSIILHSIDLYLSAVMAYIRLAVLYQLNSKWNIFLIIFSIISVLSIPTFLVHQIVPIAEVQLNNESVTFYTVRLNPQVTGNSCRLFKATLWLNGIFFKVIPCILLFIFTVSLMYKLSKMSEKRILLLGGKHRRLAIDRTTLILIILLSIFLCTELPQGALAILNAVYTSDVHKYIYIYVGELLDLLSLINCNIGFVLFCCMSSRYRTTFQETFSPFLYSIFASICRRQFKLNLRQ